MAEPALSLPPAHALPAVIGSGALPATVGDRGSAQTTSLDGFLLSAFRRFHQELVDTVGALGRASAPADDQGRNPAEISQHLGNTIQRLGLEMPTFAGAFGSRLVRETQYLMAALADETLLHRLPDWPGAADWDAHLLEARLFNSSNAGSAVFERIEALLDARDPLTVELAAIYLLALRLGFEGRHRGQGEGWLEAYRRRLFRFITGRDPALGEARARAFPQAYRHTADAAPGPGLPYLRRWLLASAVFLAAYLVVSHLVWEHNIGEVRAAIIVSPL